MAGVRVMTAVTVDISRAGAVVAFEPGEEVFGRRQEHARAVIRGRDFGDGFIYVEGESGDALADWFEAQAKSIRAGKPHD